MPYAIFERLSDLFFDTIAVFRLTSDTYLCIM